MHAVLTRRHPELAVAVIVATVTLAAGARLIELSTRQYAVRAREAAQTVTTRLGRSLDAQLLALANSAQQQTVPLAVAGSSGKPLPLGTREPGSGVFWLTTGGQILPSSASDQDAVEGIARELAAINGGAARGGRGLYGPMRFGSQWTIVARAPTARPATTVLQRQAAWTVVYRDLEQLLASASWGEINKAGYDVELTQFAPVAGRTQILYAARSTPLTGAVQSTLHFPADFPHHLPEGSWTVSIRPHAGWYPLDALAADVAILVASVWLLTLVAFDVTRSSRRWRTALAASKRRAETINLQLMQEVERREDLQKSFDHARYHDAFTGLPNRRYFMDQLDRGLRLARTKRRYRLALILVGVDRLKIVYDSMGFTAGDELMVQVARRFEKISMPLERVISRWGNDQFAVLLYDLHSIDTVTTVATMLQEAFLGPFELRKQWIKVAAHFGVTCVESGLHRAEEVVREADIALSAAKSGNGSHIVAYNTSMRDEAVSLVYLEADLHVALARRELRLLFQPIVDLQDGGIVGCEALLRWQHPVEGLLTPDRFLAIAEEAQLMVPITRWIIRRACRAAGSLSQWLPPGAPFYIGVNLSAPVLSDPGLAEFVRRTIGRAGIPAQLIRFEITEGSLISNVGPARELLDRLHGLGIKLMLDDFGTGYSSLNYLQLFPFDYLKIDRSFVSRVGSDGSGGELLQAIVQLASSLGLQAIAEGIETQDTAQALRLMGCRFGQGYLFSPPIAGSVVAQRLQDQYRGKSAGLQARSA